MVGLESGVELGGWLMALDRDLYRSIADGAK